MSEEIATLRERLASVNDKAVAAHSRMDRLENQIRDDLKEIMLEVRQLSAYMHRGKGWAAALMFLSGLFGGAVVIALKELLT